MHDQDKWGLFTRPEVLDAFEAMLEDPQAPDVEKNAGKVCRYGRREARYVLAVMSALCLVCTWS